jgi:biotin carboxylase
VSTILIHHEGGYDERAHEFAERIIHAELEDYAALESIVERLGVEEPLSRVVSLTENGLVPAARLNEKFGLGGNTVRAVTGLKNKVRMRETLEKSGLSPVRWRVVSNMVDTLDFYSQLGEAEIILKPVDGAGSVDVYRMAAPRAIAEAWRSLGPRDMLAEECLVGTEISVEAFSNHRCHTVVAFTDKKLTPNLVEVGHTIPSSASAEDKASVARLVGEFLTAMELEEGPSHTEVILTRDGPRVVESHNRVGGGSVRDLIRIAYGVDFVRSAVAVSVGIDPGLCNPPSLIAGAAVRFFVPEPGVIERFEGLEQFENDDTVSIHLTAQPGDTVPPLRSSHDRTTGFVIGRGRDAGQAAARCEGVLAAVRVVTRP